MNARALFIAGSAWLCGTAFSQSLAPSPAGERESAHARGEECLHDGEKTHPCKHGVRPPVERVRYMLLVRDCILEKYDADQDGQLNEAERKVLQSDAVALKREMKRQLLEKYDADKDGKLSEAERATMKKDCPAPCFMGRRGRPMQPPMATGQDASHETRDDSKRVVMENIRRERFAVRADVFIVAQHLLLKKYDTNKNGKLDPDEVDRMRADAGKVYDAKTKELFARWDTDGDGVLSESERAEAKRILMEEMHKRRLKGAHAVPSLPPPPPTDAPKPAGVGSEDPELDELYRIYLEYHDIMDSEELPA